MTEQRETEDRETEEEEHGEERRKAEEESQTGEEECRGKRNKGRRRRQRKEEERGGEEGRGEEEDIRGTSGREEEGEGQSPKTACSYLPAEFGDSGERGDLLGSEPAVCHFSFLLRRFPRLYYA